VVIDNAEDAMTIEIPADVICAGLDESAMVTTMSKVPTLLGLPEIKPV
jgi:hypothetical protein